MSFVYWFRFRQTVRSTEQKRSSASLNLEFLEGRMLLASPVSVAPIVGSPAINSLSGLTSSLLNPLNNLLNPVTSLVNPLLGSIINPLLGSPLPGSLVGPLVGSVLTSQPQMLSTGPLSTATSLSSAIPLPSLFGLNASNLFQPKSISTGGYPTPGNSGFGGSQYTPSPYSTVYHSAPSHQPTYSGGAGVVATPSKPEMDSSSEVGSSGGADAIVTVGLGDEEEATFNQAGLQEVVFALGDELSVPDLAASLLTGVRPRASLLPQRGSPVAPVATLLSEDASEMRTETGLDKNGRWDDLSINPATNHQWNSSLRAPSVENSKESPEATNYSTMPPLKGHGESSITDALMFGFVTAMMAFRALRSRKTDSKKNEQPELAV